MTELEHESPFEFPCQFPIKAMGKNIAGLNAVVVEIINQHVDNLSDNAVRTRTSKGAKFISITVEIEAQSKAQLNAIYTDLNACPNIVMTL